MSVCPAVKPKLISVVVYSHSPEAASSVYINRADCASHRCCSRELWCKTSTYCTDCSTRATKLVGNYERVVSSNRVWHIYDMITIWYMICYIYLRSKA